MFIPLILLFSLSAYSASPVLPGDRGIGGRIIGGWNGTIEDVPYQVSVLFEGHHHCGGSIITEFWVVSAAHCFDRELHLYEIRAGSTYREHGGIIHALELYLNHPNYGWDTVHSYDISVLKVVEPFHFSMQIQPIALPTQREQLAGGIMSLISGFGTTGWGIGGHGEPIVVQLAKVPIIPLDECRRSYGVEIITDDMLCAGYEEGGIDACQGDSGGPLVVDGVLHGAVSWGFGCAEPGFPGVYASVSYFQAWIRNIIGPF